MGRGTIGLLGVALSGYLTGGPALAQPAEPAPKAEPVAAEEPSAEKQSAEKPSAVKPSAGEPTTEDDPANEEGAVDPQWDPKELKGERYFGIGLRFRNYIVPKFIINIFAEGGGTINVFSFGPEFTSRTDGMELNFALSYVDLSFDPLLFKGKKKDVIKFEEISSSLKMIQATIDVLFEVYTSERNEFAILIGGGVGIGGVWGALRQNQIYPNDVNNPATDDLSQWRRCAGPDNPPVRDPVSGSRYCDDANEHYGDFKQPSWANGGSKPFLYPYIGLPQISLRYKPIKQLQARTDVGFAFSNGFFFGLSGAHVF
jgi:hypothetical protein